MIAGFVGFVAVIPAALIQVTIGSTGTLLYAALVFGYGLYASTFLGADVVAREQPDEDEIVELHSPTVIGASIVMMMLRAVVGFMLFLMAFWLRTQSAGTAKFGLALSTAAIATVIGNASASRLRRMLSEEQMLLGALVMSGTAGFTAAMLGGIPAMIALAFFANLAASIGRLGFEAMLQRDAPDANRGRAFATFETRFQLSWAAAGLIPVVVEMSGPTGALVIGLWCAAGVTYTLMRPRLAGRPATTPRRLRTVVTKSRLRRRAGTKTTGSPPD